MIKAVIELVERLKGRKNRYDNVKKEFEMRKVV